MRTLFSKIEPFASELLDVGEGHSIYVEQCGNKKGIPVLFLHGGPGGGCKTDHRQFFDPKKFHIVLFDQRGSGRSRPFGSTKSNNSHFLVRDIETIRTRYRITEWALFGGSWGATLGLLYAQCYPERVSALVLRGAFLAREVDLAWFLGCGANKILPVQWDNFINAIDYNGITDLPSYLFDRLNSESQDVSKETALAWEKWSGSVVAFSFDSTLESLSPSHETAICKARIELHYASNKYFLEPDQLLRDAHKIPDIRVILIHGGRDMTCLPGASWDLHKAIPHSRLEILRTAGHLSSDPQMIDALIRASGEIVDYIG